MPKGDIRVYGNQHGTWIEVKGELLSRLQTMAHLTGTTVEALLMEIIDKKCREVLGEKAA
jgi:hypothetical protein